jgi:hypothetical protein
VSARECDRVDEASANSAEVMCLDVEAMVGSSHERCIGLRTFGAQACLLALKQAASRMSIQSPM